MRYIFYFWVLPLGLFWGWYFLSFNDVFFSREFHDMAFRIYGDALGLEPGAIPGLVARACVFDSFLVMGIYAFRRRNTLWAWGRTLWASYSGRDVRAASARNLSSAP